MLQYRAALMLPQLPNMMTFYELHSMHVPAFMPGRDWLYRLHKQRRWDVSTRMNITTPRHMQPPMFLDTVWVGDQLMRWIFLFDRRFPTHLPGLRFFESFPDLLDKLLYEDLDMLREVMRRYN